MIEYSTQLDVKDGLNKARIENGNFKYIKGFEVLSLKDGAVLNLKTGDYETGLVVFKGKCDIDIDGKSYKDIGGRGSVFSGSPAGVYIPIGKKYTVKSRGGVELAICSSVCDKASEFAVIKPEDVKEMEVGKDNWKRHVRIIIGPSSPSVNLIVGETINPPGNWSGTPAHKHEKVNLPAESLHEELYYFRVDKPQGFGIERLYSPEKNMNELIYLKDNTVTFMPWGYHQIVAAPGYTLYYLFFLSGEGKSLAGFADPDHKWLNT